MESKVVIVTGGANGIGAAIAKAYVAEKYQVVIADYVQPKEISENALFIQTDMKNPADVESLVQKVITAFGRIDIVINNAGRFIVKSPLQLEVEEWDDIIQTNLRGAFLCTREAAKYMNGGSIIMIASTRAIQSEPNTEAYAASKGGLVALTHAFASSLSEKRITVNCISPGWIETGDYDALREVDHNQHFSKRVGKPEDIARACLYLTDEQNDFVTGAHIIIDGGMTRNMIYEP